MSSSQPPDVHSRSHQLQFWGVFSALCLLSFISALDVAIITTSLPSITADIGGATQYVWIANSFVVASSVLQPLYGQLADILGRRTPFVSAIVLFTLGSGIAGGASNVAMLIAGRVVQGVGAGGIYLLLSIVCCDLVPLRERGKYLGLMNACAGVAAALGPALGGVIASRNWRWIFYLNIPICGVALGIVLIFMRMKTGNKEDIRWKGQIARMDWIGNLIFTPSMIAILFGLVMGGTQFSWSSWHILVPLIVGAFGWVAFHTWEHFCINPSIPSRLFRNRTSAAAYALTFISSITVQAQSYFIPLYFQAALGNTILEAGTNFLPFAIGTLGSAAISGILLSKFGAYRRLHGVSFALSAIGFGLLTLLDGHTPKVGWVFIELVASAGSGSIISVLLPAIMAALSEDDVAAASAAFAFTKTFGYTWGVTIASIIFNSTFDRNLYLINSPELRRELKNGGAYGFASQVHLRHDLSVDTRRGLVLAYTRSLRAIWWFGLAISLVGFLVTGLERKLELRKTLDTAYGLDGADGKEKPSPEVTDSIEASITQKEGA